MSEPDFDAGRIAGRNEMGQFLDAHTIDQGREQLRKWRDELTADVSMWTRETDGFLQGAAEVRWKRGPQ
jgi:hypothetical protein